jgi:cob(I)alamin adenosyltransferase
VVTGRDPSEEWLKASDYVTEMTAVKHPYNNGLSARKGIEY